MTTYNWFYLDRDRERDCVRLLTSMYEIFSICIGSLSFGDDGIEWIDTLSESESVLTLWFCDGSFRTVVIDVDSVVGRTPVPKPKKKLNKKSFKKKLKTTNFSFDSKKP